MDHGAVIIDTRCADVRRLSGVIPGSVHVPLSVLYWRLDPTSGHADPATSDPERQIVLVCAHGFSSSLAAATLHELGFSRATDIVGGFEAWAAAGLPVEPLSD
jgi:rhodanese-related sulfurtransferase